MKKQTLIRLFLDFVAGFVPIKEAWLATLGGGGVEPAIWKEIGVPEKQGWLIESSRKKGDTLIRNFSYPYCSQLSAFPHFFTSVRGPEGGVDGFHLDLCGTFEGGDTRELFGTILPLVMRSRGRCFAITVADARSNRSLIEFDVVQAELSSLIGEDAMTSFLFQLLGEHERDTSASNSEMGAKRELGFATALISLMVEERLYELDQIHRYRYVSDTHGGNFPMRTYFFHFAKRGPGRRRLLGAHETIALWRQSTLHEVSAEGIINLLPEKGKESEMGTPYPNLEQLATYASPAVQKELKELLEDAECGRALKKAGLSLASSNGSAGTTAITVRSSARKRPSKPAVSTSITDPKTLAQIAMVLGKAESKEAYRLAFNAAGKVLKAGRGRTRQNKIGSAFAVTQGKHRWHFVQRLLRDGADDALLGQLAKAYSVIDKTTVTVESLRKEAQAGRQ